MKTKWFILPVIALSLGCTREIDTNVSFIDGEFTLYSSSGEKETKTIIQQDGSIFWSPEDCIKVFYGDTSGKFTSTNTEPTASAEFTGSLGSFVLDGETEFIAVYPYSDYTILGSDNNILSIVLPSEQTAVEGTFADDLFVCVAKSKDVYLHFYNVCGGVKFSLVRDDIKKVVFKGNNGEILAGRMAVVFNSEGLPQVTEINAGNTSIALTAPDDGTFKVGSWYYLVLAPQSLTKGYTMELWTDELAETLSQGSSVTVRRSAWGTLKNLGNHNSPTAVPEAVDLGLSVKWASFNLGATIPEEYGDYYAWGETEPYYICQDPLTWKEGKEAGYDWASYQWCMGADSTWTKYCSNPEYGYNGFADNKTVLDPEDDVAHVNLGGRWRMPTQEELYDLQKQCIWEWTQINGVKGRKVTGPNGNSIFLPAAGMWFFTRFNGNGSFGRYWSSSKYPGSSNEAIAVMAGDRAVIGEQTNRLDGLSIRPVYGGDSLIGVESVSLAKTELELFTGETATLLVTVLPENAENKRVSWSSSDSSVASVSSSGAVSGISVGTAVITVTTIDGGKTATCNVTIHRLPPSIPEAIDLGLPSGTKWASFNLGASKPEEYGDYYAWGETEPYYKSIKPLYWKEDKKKGYDWASYQWCMGTETTLTKYCSDAKYGYVGFADSNNILDPEDDAAYVHLGDKMKIPTDANWTEIREQCTWEWAQINGVKGRKVTGSNGNSIFLPAAGCRNSTTHDEAESGGFYWSSSLRTDTPYSAWYVFFNSDVVIRYDDARYFGFSIRPVYDE